MRKSLILLGTFFFSLNVFANPFYDLGFIESAENEVSLNIDKDSAEKLIDYFNLGKSLREDVYIDIFEQDHFVLEKYKFRLKKYLRKSKSALQVSKTNFLRNFRCGKFYLKNLSKTKYDKYVDNSLIKRLLSATEEVQNDLLDEGNLERSILKFNRVVDSVEHGAKSFFEKLKTNNSYWVPTKRTIHKKFTGLFEHEFGIVKIKVGEATDYIGKDAIERRYDLEFSNYNEEMSLNDLREIACNTISRRPFPKIIQVVPNQDASLKTLDLLNKRK